MKWIVHMIALSAIISGCGGKLSDEQRQRIRQDMKEGEIKKVSEAEFTEAAFRYGRKVKEMIAEKDPHFKNAQFIDSLAGRLGVVVKSLKEGDSLRQIEKQVFAAYQNSPLPGNDNVQKIAGDSILFTWPVPVKHDDGTLVLSHVGALRISNKQIILSIED
ncbi:MAG: hypothetical protein AB7K37_02515 [Cyclobacteriaceae bacterium]